MSDLGNKIIKLRKQENLTQEQMGKLFNVSAQAVSKWEKGISEPDIGTLTSICKHFNISMDDLLGTDTAVTPEPIIIEKEVPVIREVISTTKVENSVIVGYCKNCNKPIQGDEKYHQYDRNNGIICDNCYKKLQKAHAFADYNDCSKHIKLGLIFGGIGGVAVLIAMIIVGIVNSSAPMAICGIFLAYFTFAFISQLFYSEFFQDFFMFFLKTFRMPGVIFELSLDGIISLIFIKLTLAILSILLSIVFFFIGVIICFFGGGMTFPFTIVANLMETKKLKSNYEKLKKAN